MSAAPRWLAAALASGAVHAGALGAVWAMRESPAQQVELVPRDVPTRAPVQVSLLSASPAGGRAVGVTEAVRAPEPGTRPGPRRTSARAPRGEVPTSIEVEPGARAHPQEAAAAPAAESPEAPTAALEGQAPTGTGSGTPHAAEAAAGPGGRAGSGTGTGTGTGSGSGAQPGADAPPVPDLSRLTDALRRSAQRCYPAAAARFRLTGSASVSFCVESGGGFSSLQLVRSSGHALLDRAAVSCVVQGAVPLQVPPSCFTLPVEFTPAAGI